MIFQLIMFFLVERVVLQKDFFSVYSAFSVLSKVGEKCENDIFEPVNV
jgi:hypothetical protein